MELNNDRNAERSILSAYFKACVACSPTVVVAPSPTMVVVQLRYVQYIEYHLCAYNVKRLAVIEFKCVYTLCITLCIRSMYTIYKKQAERGCFCNIPFQRLIPKSNR